MKRLRDGSHIINAAVADPPPSAAATRFKGKLTKDKCMVKKMKVNGGNINGVKCF